MGRVASQILTGKRMSMKRLRGNFMDYRGIPLMPIYHPAYLIRARQREGGKTVEDKLTWHDLQAVMKFLKNER
jgi:DNA polymerase